MRIKIDAIYPNGTGGTHIAEVIALRDDEVNQETLGLIVCTKNPRRAFRQFTVQYIPTNQQETGISPITTSYRDNAWNKVVEKVEALYEVIPASQPIPMEPEETYMTRQELLDRYDEAYVKNLEKQGVKFYEFDEFGQKKVDTPADDIPSIADSSNKQEIINS